MNTSSPFEEIIIVDVTIVANQYYTRASMYNRDSHTREMIFVRVSPKYGPSDVLKPAVKTAIDGVRRSRNTRVFVEQPIGPRTNDRRCQPG